MYVLSTTWIESLAWTQVTKTLNFKQPKLRSTCHDNSSQPHLFRTAIHPLHLNFIILSRPACPSSLFHTWETLLQEVEIDSQAMGDIGSILGRQVSRPLLEKSFYRKIQSRKVFTHRESYETIIAKTEEKLAKVGRWVGGEIDLGVNWTALWV